MTEYQKEKLAILNRIASAEEDKVVELQEWIEVAKTFRDIYEMDFMNRWNEQKKK